MIRREIVSRNPLVRQFLEKSINDESHIPITRKLNEFHWMRNLEITLLSTLGPYTYKEVGNRFKITRSAVDLIRRSTLKILWRNSPLDVQLEFPLDVILKTRQKAPLASRLRQSANQGGRLALALEAAQTDGAEGLRKAGFSNPDISNYRSSLRAVGVDLPSQKAEKNSNLRNNLSNRHSDIETQKLLNEVDKPFLDYERRLEIPTVTSFKSILKSLGLKMTPQEIRKIYLELISKGIPAASIPLRIKKGESEFIRSHYYFIASYDLERARQAIEENPVLFKSLQSPVEIILGSSEKPKPTTHQLVHKVGFFPIGKIAKIVNLTSQEILRYLAEQSMTVYRYRRTNFIDANEAEAFVNALRLE